MRKLLGGFLVGVLAVLSVLVFGIAIVWRFGLITVQPSLGYFIFGLFMLTVGGLLKAYERYAWFMRLFLTAGTILFALGVWKVSFPRTSESATHAQVVADMDGANAIDEKIGPTPIRCDRDVHPDRFWNPSTGTAVVFYVVTDETGRIECANRTGFHGISRQRYLPVTEAVVKAILAQTSLTPPVTTACNPQIIPAPLPPPTLPAAAPEEKLITIVTR